VTERTSRVTGEWAGKEVVDLTVTAGLLVVPPCTTWRVPDQALAIDIGLAEIDIQMQIGRMARDLSVARAIHSHGVDSAVVEIAV